ncbi:MAG: efflux RND transporter permease subunit [Gammaproteobacteria bacterium]
MLVNTLYPDNLLVDIDSNAFGLSKINLVRKPYGKIKRFAAFLRPVGITRQLEEQLAITEGVIRVQSTTTEGRSNVNLSFPYGTDIDVALRESSTRLDRAKRFLPDTIDPPTIFKRDPSQIPVLELAISSDQRDPIALRDWVDYEFSRWFLNIPGVAAAEVGGGIAREIHVRPDQERLASLGLSLQQLADAIDAANQEEAGGRLTAPQRELSLRTSGRFATIEELAAIPIWKTQNGNTVRLGDVAQVLDSHADERLKIRLNQIPGIKLSVQKQPEANTVAVVDAVERQLEWLRTEKILPDDILVQTVGDQSIFVRHALNNASTAALSGAILAMLVVYLFLGDLRRTLIIGSAIPVALLLTFTIMSLSGLTLNIMTLGGLALGIGMLVDNTIVMMENIHRHQSQGEDVYQASINASSEINSAIVASTATNLAAVLPFLFISGLVGLLFKELIITLSAAIVGSLMVAITLVPALASKIRFRHETRGNRIQAFTQRVIAALQRRYVVLLGIILARPWLPLLVLALPLALTALKFMHEKSIFLPQPDEGHIMIRITADPGLTIQQMEDAVQKLEHYFSDQEEIKSVFTLSGGSVFGRSEYQSSSRSSLDVQLRPGINSEDWIKKTQKAVAQLGLVGFRIRIYTRGIRGVRINQGDDDISLRIQGDDIATLRRLGDEVLGRIRDVPGLKNLQHTYEDFEEELTIKIDRDRAAEKNISIKDIGIALRVSMEGQVISEFMQDDRAYPIRLRLPKSLQTSVPQINQILVGHHNRQPVRLHEVASIALHQAPASIAHDQQRRIVEIGGSLEAGFSISEVISAMNTRLEDLSLPEGYYLYDGGSQEALHEGQRLGTMLLGLALFLVFVVMAVQYESLRNPFIIMLCTPFATIGVALGLTLTGIPLSMPVWLGLIMLVGIVVNNSIVLVEQIEIEREKQTPLQEAIITAARLRLRPILMTTLTTVVGMLPLALALGQGAEMLQPLAMVMVFGLLFSMLVSLGLLPAIYWLFNRRQASLQP